MSAAEARRWEERLRAAGGDDFPDVVVLAEIDSTQDELRRRRPQPGAALAALRQTQGRGSRGRRWLDDDADGAAATATITLALRPEPAPRLMVRAALAAHDAVRGALDAAGVEAASGVKWPNDVVVEGADGAARKIAGVLIEQADGCALVGIGVNVAQRRLPAPIAALATSLVRLGAPDDRPALLERLLRTMRARLLDDETALRARYREVDRLRGTRRRFATPAGLVEGVVEAIDPFSTIDLRRDDGALLRIEPATATLVAG